MDEHQARWGMTEPIVDDTGVSLHAITDQDGRVVGTSRVDPNSRIIAVELDPEVAEAMRARTEEPGADFDCEAYGPDTRVPGGCFMARTEGTCANAATCAGQMSDERQRLWDVLQEKARQDPIMAEVLRSLQEDDGVSGPDDLLGGTSPRR